MEPHIQRDQMLGFTIAGTVFDPFQTEGVLLAEILHLFLGHPLSRLGRGERFESAANGEQVFYVPSRI